MLFAQLIVDGLVPSRMEDRMMTNRLAKALLGRGGDHFMSRYFFHVRRGQVTVLDHEGTELEDAEEAAREAARRGREIAARDALQGVAPCSGVIVVANEHWSAIFEVPMEGDEA